MAVVAKMGEQQGKPAPTGTFAAVCVQVIDLGHQYSEFYDKTAHKVMLGWELQGTDEPREDGRPWIAWKRYTLSLGEKSNLRRDLQAWRSRPFTAQELEGFDLRKVLGAPALVTITHRESNGRTYTDVSNVTSLPKQMPASAPAGQQIYFDIDEPDMAAFRTFSDGLRTTIESSSEWKARQVADRGEAPTADAPPVDDDSIPF